MTPRKKDAEPLARERIVAAAMKIIDAEGLDALSMRRLGAELGVNPMAAYHYVPNKAALYDLVLEAVMAGVDTETIDPALRLSPISSSRRRAPTARRSSRTRAPSPSSPRARCARRPCCGRSSRCWASSTPRGLTPDEAMAAVDFIAQFVLGGAVGYYHHEFDDEAGEQREFEALDPAEFPNTIRMITEAHYLGPDGEFEFGLDAVIHGLLTGPRRLPEGRS